MSPGRPVAGALEDGEHPSDSPASPTTQLNVNGSDQATANADESSLHYDETDVVDENDTSEMSHCTATTPQQVDHNTITTTVDQQEEAGECVTDVSLEESSPGSVLDKDENDNTISERIKDKSDDSNTSPRSSDSQSDNNSDSEGSSSSSRDSEESASFTFESIRREYEQHKNNNHVSSRQQSPEGAPAPLTPLPEPGLWPGVRNNHTGSPRRASGAGRGSFESTTARGGPARGSRPGRGEGRMSVDRGIVSALSGTSLVKSLSGKGLGRSSSTRGLGRGSPPGRGRGRGRGRGLLGAKSSKSRPDINDETDSARRGGKRPVMKRAATERFSYKPGEDDEDNPLAIPKFKRKMRSLSMDLGSKPKAEKESFLRPQFPTNRYSVTFGASREQAHYQPKTIRRSHKLDIHRGGETQREVVCQRIIDYPLAMNPAERRRKLVLRTGNDKGNRLSIHGDVAEPQWRLQSKNQSSGFKEQLNSQTVRPGTLTTYLIWSLRSPFLFVLLSEACAFWFLISIFASCIYLGAKYQPECLRLPDHRNFEEGGAYFLDAYTLSWTTFSTVGYGLVHPQVQKEPDATSFNCAFMTTIVSLESFVGVLFASFCGAVIVGKMTRAKSTASIRYSQRMILRFGTGIMNTNDDDDRCDDREEKPVTDYEKRRTKFPCPVLEFRVANSLFGNDNGEIMNAKINVVGQTLAENDAAAGGKSVSVMGSVMNSHRPSFDALNEMRNSANRFIRKQVKRPFGEGSGGDRFKRSSMSGGSKSISTLSSDTDKKPKQEPLPKKEKKAKQKEPTKKSKEEEPPKKEKKRRVLRRVSTLSHAALESVIMKKKLMRPTDSAEDRTANQPRKTSSKKKAICVEEDPTGGLAPRKMFSSIQIECATHPFFKRVWTIRHVLNADSPLLSTKASRMIKESKGLWPAGACNCEFIRENVQFQQLIVSLSGTSGASKVYGMNVYEYRNLHVGYTFAPILETALDGKLEVAIDRIDNLREQRGGGAEPIDHYEANRHRKDFFRGESSEFHLDMSTSAKNEATPRPEDCFMESATKVGSVHDLKMFECENENTRMLDDASMRVEDPRNLRKTRC